MSLTFPASPTDGQVELLGGRQYIWSAAKARWENYGGFAQISYTRPTNPAQGELFFNPDANLFEVWDVNQWKQLSTGGGEVTPIGTIQYFSATTAPQGFLICNGDTIPNGSGTVQGVTTDFSSLYTVIGSTFGAAGKLPDLRGEFIRGADEGRGVDSGRVFGTDQAEDFKSHNHDFQSPPGDANTADSQGWTPTGGARTGFKTSDRPTTTETFAAIDARGGSETRPRNVALLPCIKYSGFQVPVLSTIPVDTFRENVLFHLPGADFTDTSNFAQTVNTFGNAFAGNATSKWGGGSIAFDGVGDYISFDTPGALQMDFTAEAWIYPDALPGNNVGIFYIGRTDNNNWRIQLDYQTNGVMQVYVQGTTSNTQAEGTTVCTPGQWWHVACTKKSNAIYVFVNGNLEDMVEITNINWEDATARGETTCHFGVNRAGGSARYFDGKMEDLRITTPPRYLGNYIVPTAALPTSQPYLSTVNQAVASALPTTEGVVYGQTPANNTDSVLLGYETGQSVGTNCTIIGGNAAKNSTGSNNTVVGASAGQNLTSGDSNILVGQVAGANVITGVGNVFVGQYAGLSAGDISQVTILGSWSGSGAQTGSIGIATGGGTLRQYINSSGALSFNNTANFGTAGQFLKSNGSGSPPSWANANSFTQLNSQWTSTTYSGYIGLNSIPAGATEIWFEYSGLTPAQGSGYLSIRMEAAGSIQSGSIYQYQSGGVYDSNTSDTRLAISGTNTYIPIVMAISNSSYSQFGRFHFVKSPYGNYWTVFGHAGWENYYYNIVQVTGHVSLPNYASGIYLFMSNGTLIGTRTHHINGGNAYTTLRYR